jgi:hypothetical protein
VNLDEIVAQLYALPPEEFTAARGEAVAAARKAGERDLAKQIGGLRRAPADGRRVAGQPAGAPPAGSHR